MPKLEPTKPDEQDEICISFDIFDLAGNPKYAPAGTQCVSISGGENAAIVSSASDNQARLIHVLPFDDNLPSPEQANYISDLTLPDGTVVSPGQVLVKTWRMRNIGTTTWDSGYEMAFTGGERMGAPNAVNVSQTAPGQEVDISVNLTAPTGNGEHTGYWRLRNPDGTYFGPTVWVRINVQSASSYITTLMADPPSPSNANNVRIHARAENFPNFRAMRLKIDGNVVYELGAPEFYYDWQTSGYTVGDHSIVVEVANQTDTSWSQPESKGLTYTLEGTTGSINHAPNRPIPVANPAYDWYVTIGNPPQLCAQAQGDPDGDAVTHYRFVATAPVGTVDSGWVNNSCYTVNSLTPGTYEWHAQVKDNRGGISDWSDKWHFTVEPAGVTAYIDHFSSASPSSAEELKIYGCSSGHAGVNITLRVLVNDANDGTDSGDWDIIKEQGSPCFNDIDAPVWHTLEYADGPHLVRVVAMAIQPDAGDVYDEVYVLNHRVPDSPRLLAPVPFSQDLQEAIYLNSRTVTFRWGPAIRADNYTLHISTDPAPKDDPTPVFRQEVYQQTGETSRVSVASNGTEGNGTSGYFHTSISIDGSYITFPSSASNLVDGDTNGSGDIFIHDQTTGQTARVSIASDGTEGNSGSGFPSISANGRYVAFYSFSNNLVPGDTNNVCDGNGDGVYNENCGDVFVHDRLTEQTKRVSLASNGVQGNGISGESGLEISADGRYVAFSSGASNLVSGDNNNYCLAKDGTPAANCEDVFVHDTQTGQTTRISVASDGTEGNQASYAPSISADGRFIAFYSGASNLVPNDSNNHSDIFVHDIQTGQTTLVSINADGTPGNSDSGGFLDDLSISADGRYVAFRSYASNLVNGDTNDTVDIFVYDRQTGQTTRASVASDGSEGNGQSGFFGVSISADGRYVAFYSEASNLVPGDMNDYCDEYGNPGGNLNCPDILIHDMQTGQTELVSVDSNGAQGNGYGSWYPSISADGKFVSFASISSDLVPGDTNAAWDVFVHQAGSSSATEYTVTFDQDYPTLYWQITADNDVGTNASGGQRFGIDREDPSCTIQPLPATTYENIFQVSWNGLDNLAGIRTFDIQYKDSERGIWTDWLTSIPSTKTYELFTGQPGHSYAFRCRAIDGANNLGNYPISADTSTTIDPTAQSQTPWWDLAYNDKRNIIILNNMPGAELPVGYPVHLYFDSSTIPTAADIYNASQSTPKCDDLRIVYNDTTELDRIVKKCSASSIEIWFRTQVSIPDGSSDSTSHQLYYGNPNAGAPPANPNNVWYPFAESDTTNLYFFQEGTGSTTYDASGFNRNCSIDSSVQWSSGKFGDGLRFNHANAGDSRSLNCGAVPPLTNFTIEFWYKPDSDDGGRIVGALSGGGNGGGGSNWLLQLQGGKIRLDTWECSTCGSQEVSSNFNLLQAPYLGHWNHIAITFDGVNQVRFYINGILDSTKTLADAGINTFSPPLEIGSAEGIGQIKANLGAFRISDNMKTSFPYGAYGDITNEPTLATGSLIEPPTTGSADLAFWDLNTYPNPGGGVLIEAVIQNQGNLSTQNGFYTDLYVDHLPTGTGDYTGSLQFWINDAIAAGTTITLTTVLNELVTSSGMALHTMTPGSEVNGTVYAQVDSSGVIGEASDTDNIYTDGVEICLANPDAYEEDETYNSASPIILSETQEHNFDHLGDQDWIQFAAQNGDAYALITYNLDQSADTYIYLYDVDGTTLLASNDDYASSLASRIEWIAPATGTYYVLIRHWNPNVSGCKTSYSLRLAEPGFELFLPIVIR